MNQSRYFIATVAVRSCSSTGAFTPLPSSSIASGGEFQVAPTDACLAIRLLDSNGAVVGEQPSYPLSSPSWWEVR